MTISPRAAVLSVTVAIAAVGCSTPLETSYGHVRGTSINGTSVLSKLFSAHGNEVRVAVHLTEELAAWAETVVRFAPYPGPPDQAEADWYDDWLTAGPNHRLIYVIRDFDSQPEYWSAVLAMLPKSTSLSSVESVRRQLEIAQNWARRLPPRSRDPASKREWFAVKLGPLAAVTCAKLTGPWATGIDRRAAAVSKHDTLQFDAGDPAQVLLSGDGDQLAASWVTDNGGQVLVVANGGFLLNGALANRARRPLAQRVVAWPGNEARRTVFLEGQSPTEASSVGPRPWTQLVKVDPLGWIAAHLLMFGLLGCLYLATHLGRARAESHSLAERPVAHAEALGDLLYKTQEAATARVHLEAYTHWRHSSASAQRQSERE